jgi:hypothetical protein
LTSTAEDAFEVPLQRRGQLLERRQSLPADAAHPVVEEAASGTLVGVAPQALDLLFEEVGFEQSAVEREGLVPSVTTS